MEEIREIIEKGGKVSISKEIPEGWIYPENRATRMYKPKVIMPKKFSGKGWKE